jgi:DNA-directed RNA polymerase specialized sigma24 family protein
LNNFLTNNYDAIILMAKKICRSHIESEEVAHFAISEFMEHERGQELVDTGRAMNFLSGIIHRSFHSSTSKYHTIYRQKGRMHELPVDYDNIQNDDEYSYEQDMATEAIQGVLEDMKANGIELWFRAALFEMYIKEPNFSELARQTKIPRTSISKAVEEAREYIQLTLKNNNINP